MIKNSTEGFISIGIIIAIVVSILAAGAAGYGVYKYSEVKKENKDLAEQIIKQNETEEIIEKEIAEEEESEEIKSQVDTDTKKLVVTPTAPVVEPPLIVKKPEVVQEPIKITSVRCDLSREDVVDRNQLIKAKLKDISVGISKYNIVWDNEYLINNREKENTEATFSFDEIGYKTLSATLARISDGHVFRVDCPEIKVLCNDFGCLSEKAKKILILENIIDEIDSWYGEYPEYVESVHCPLLESVVRALEYKYTLMGGVNLSPFKKEVDCASIVAPRAYQYKIELLIDSL